MFLLSKVSSKQIFTWHALTMLSDRRYWNPYNFPRLLGYRSDLLTIVRLGSVLKQLQVAFSLLFSIFARGGVAWFYNIFNKRQDLVLDPYKQSEVFSKKPRFIKSGLQIFNWHPGSLSNHKYLAFYSRCRLKDLFSVEPSFMVNARRIEYRSNNFMRSLDFKRKFRRPFWQRRNRFWRYKRLSRVKFLDTRRIFLRIKKKFRRRALSLKTSEKKVHLRHFAPRPVPYPLDIINNSFISVYNPNSRENCDTNLSIEFFQFNWDNRQRSFYAYTSYKKPNIVVPEMETLKPGTPEKPNVLPVDNMPTASIRRIQKKKRKLEKKLFDPFYTEIAEDFFLLKDLFFSNLVYKEKRWFSFRPFLITPPRRFYRIVRSIYSNKCTRRALRNNIFKRRKVRRYRFFRYDGKPSIKWRDFRQKRSSYKKKMRNRRLRYRRRSRRRYYFRICTRTVSKHIRKLMHLSLRMSRYLYRSRDFIFADIYLRYFRGHYAQRLYGYIHLNLNNNINPYYKLSFDGLSVLNLKKISGFKSRFDYINEIRYIKRFHKAKYYKKRKLKANTLFRVPGTFNFSLKKQKSTENFERLFSFNKPNLRLKFSKKKKIRNFDKTYITSRKPFFQKTPTVRIKRRKLKTCLSVSYKKKRLYHRNPKITVRVKRRLLVKEAATYFKQFYRHKKNPRLFPSILLVASLSRYALSVLNEAQCVGVSLIYFTDAAVSPLCNLFNVVMNSQITILSSMEININLIFNKAKVFNLISRVW